MPFVYNLSVFLFFSEKRFHRNPKFVLTSLSEISVLINRATDAVHRTHLLVTLALVIGFKTKNCLSNLNQLPSECFDRFHIFLIQ